MEGETGDFSSSNIPYNFEHSKNTDKKILKPIRQEKIVKVPVTQYVEKIIEKEQIKYVNKYVDVIKPIIKYKTKHIPKPIYLDKIKYEPKLIEKEKIIHIPKTEYRNKVVEIPVYIHREKIIEKKIPLVIERVVPVLKVKKIEKEVLTNSLEVPEISDLTKNERDINILKNFNESNREVSNKISLNKNDYPINLKFCDKRETYDVETYRQHESESGPINYSVMQVPRSDIDKLKDYNINNNNHISSDEDSYKAHLNHKNETKYHDITNDDPNYDIISNNGNRIINSESNSKEYLKGSMEENYYDISEKNKNFNTSHVSIHLPTSQNIVQESVEQSYMNAYDNNSNIPMNRIVDNSPIIGVDNNFNRYNGDDINGMINEQLIHRSYNGSKIYPSIPVHGNNVHSYSTITKEQMKMGKKPINPSNMHISYENYTSSQNLYGQRPNPRKSNFKPSYANSNGQAIVSVRPATIVELQPKPRKNKTSLCNFMNNCCGGNEL